MNLIVIKLVLQLFHGRINAFQNCSVLTFTLVFVMEIRSTVVLI